MIGTEDILNELSIEDILKRVERNNDQQRSQHAYRDSVPGTIALLLPTHVASDMYSHTNPCHARLRARESQELWARIPTANHGHVGVHFGDVDVHFQPVHPAATPWPRCVGACIPASSLFFISYKSV